MGSPIMSALKKVLPSILQKHCCIWPNRKSGLKRWLMKLKSREIYSESQCMLCAEAEDQPYSWSPIQYFDEDSYPSPPRNMKGLSGGRPQLNITTGHSCGLADCDHSLDHLQHGAPDSRSSYLLSPTESYPMDHHRCSPRSSIHSECMVMPVSMASDHVSSSTFPRMHYSSHHESSREDVTTGHGSGGSGSVVGVGGVGGGVTSSGSGSGKMNRIPANLLDQFEKQLPIHRDGFHTLQYQRTSTATTNSEQRNESPGRIRHLVHSVQKLFTKSHSLEGSSKMNGTKGDSRSESSHHHHGHHHGHHKHSKRSKSKERKADSKHRSGIAGWWSSDDNLDSDSTYRTPSVMSRHHVDHISHCYPEPVPGHFGDLSLKTSKSNNDVKCSACEGIALAPEGKFMKRSSWSTLTVSQAKEAYRKSSLNLEKPMMPQDLKLPLRPCHYLQVPQDEWGGYPGVKDDEIPCRRMRSSSYVKAMGDEESGDSDGSPKNSPQKSVRSGGFIKNVLQRQLSDQSSYRFGKSSSDSMKYLANFAADLSHSYHLQASRDIHPSITLDPSPNYNSPKFRSRNQSYMRAVSTLSQASCVSQVSQVSEAEMNGQFESVCESVFSEVESQAMEALDLPGCFRTRSHSYLRAIQAGYSQDDECVPSMSSSTVTSTIRSTAEGNELLEGMGLLNEDSFFNKETDMTSVAQRDHHRSESESRSLYSNRSSTTVPSLSSHKTSFPVRPRPVPSSVQETADLALAISQQWREDVSAMRKELADLRRDLCTELRAFNSNFSSFAQRYNTWSPNLAKGSQNRSDHVSVSTQAGSKTLMRQNTADAAVNCPSPIDPNVLSMHCPNPEILDKNVLRVSTSRPLFQTEPTSQLTELDDPTYANLTPPEPVDLSMLSWPELDPDSMTPPDPPEPELPVHLRYYSKISTSERVDSIVVDIPNIEPVNLANLHWPKLDADNIISQRSSSPQEPLKPSVPHSFIQESLEESEACPLSSGLHVATEQQHPIRKSVVSPIVLIELTEETSEHNLEDYTVVEPGDCLVLNPLTPESMDLNDLKWPSIESLDHGLPSPGFSDLPDPPTPETTDYDEPADPAAEEPPIPELLDTIFLQPATPEPADSDVSNPMSPEPMSPGFQSSAKFEPEAHPVVLWSKKETMDLNLSDFPHLNIRTSSWSEMDPEIISPSEPTYMESSVAYLTQLSSLESVSVTLHEPSPSHLDDQFPEESDGQVTDYPLKADALDSAMIDLLESEAVFSAILCTVEPDDPEFETLTMDEAMEIANPGNSSPATIDPATVHPFNLSLLELQAALDVSKRETTDNGSPRGTKAGSSSPSCRDFLWIRWQRRLRGRTPMSRSASMELYHKKYSNNSEMSYMSLSI